jgi:energy-converting hydrogenase Eha subunit A
MRMYWKMSIDLSRPVVHSMGQHDPLEGFITYSELQVTYREAFGQSLDLRAEIADMARICRDQSWFTDDPLGIGGLLSNASIIAQVMIIGGLEYSVLLKSILDSALLGMESFTENDPLKFPAEYRLAFRELGLSIGLKGMKNLLRFIKNNPDVFSLGSSLKALVEALIEYVPISEKIEQFWLNGENRHSSNWIEHREINMVMLATSIVPEGFLII